MRSRCSGVSWISASASAASASAKLENFRITGIILSFYARATVTASEFTAKCLHLLDEAAQSGSTLVVTKHKRPVAQVLPVDPSSRPLWK